MVTDLSTILVEKKNLDQLEQQAEEVKMRISNFLEAVVQQRGKSFQQDGKWYQIRKRNGKHYICEFDVEPGSWLRKSK